MTVLLNPGASEAPTPASPRDAIEPAAPARRAVGHRVLLGGIVVLALILRLWGIDWQLPYLIYHDELKYVLTAAAGESYVDIDDDPEDYRNPWLFHHLLELEYRALAALSLTQLGDPPSARPDVLGRQLLIARVTVALFATAAVGLMYLVGRRAFGPRTGLLAAALLAVNPLQIHLAHFALNDVPAHFFMVAALLAAVELYRQPRALVVLVTGLLVGLSAATKYNYGIVVVVPLAVLVVQARRRMSLKQVLDYGVLLGTGGLAGFMLGMPEVLWRLGDMLDGIREQSDRGLTTREGQDEAPVFVLYGQSLMRAFGLPALIAALVGLVVLARRRPGLAIVLAACPVLYLGIMLTLPKFAARFALLPVPFLCLFAAYALAISWTRVVSPGLRVLLVAISCLVVLVPPAVLSVRIDQLATRMDSRVEARRWVQETIPAGSSLALQMYSMPITLERDPLHDAYDLTFFTRLSNDEDFTRLACRGVQYVLIASYRWETQRTTSRGGDPTGYELLEARGQLVRSFDQGPNHAHVPLNLDDMGIPFWDTERYARPGPTIKAYRLLPGAC